MNVEDVSGGEAPVFFRFGFDFVIGTVADCDRPPALHKIESVDIAELGWGSGVTDLGEGCPGDCDGELPTGGLSARVVDGTISEESEFETWDFEAVIAGSAADVGFVHAEVEGDAKGVDFPFEVVVAVAIGVEE